MYIAELSAYINMAGDLHVEFAWPREMVRSSFTRTIKLERYSFTISVFSEPCLPISVEFYPARIDSKQREIGNLLTRKNIAVVEMIADNKVLAGEANFCSVEDKEIQNLYDALMSAEEKRIAAENDVYSVLYSL